MNVTWDLVDVEMAWRWSNQGCLFFLKTTPKIRGGGHDNISEEGGSFDENTTSVGPVNDVQWAGIKKKDCEKKIRP